MSSDAIVIDLPYLAPVPAGHEVLISKLAKADAGLFDAQAADCVIDRTTRVVYADRSYLDVLAANPTTARALPIDAPADALGPGWSVKQSATGQVVCTVLSTADGMERSSSRTRLYVRSAPPTTYR